MPAQLQRNPFRLALLPGLIGLLTAQAAMSQDEVAQNTAASNTKIESVTVIGQKQPYRGDTPLKELPQAIEVFNADVLKDVGAVRLENLLTMRSGLAADDDVDGLPGNEDRLDEADDPLAFALSVPAAEPQGARYRYNSLAAYVAGVVVARATGKKLEDFARAALFEPLGMRRWQWQEDRARQTKGQGNLFLTALDFAHIGQLVLGNGMYDGKRIVSRRWIERSLHPRVDISANDPYATGYGYYWYHRAYPVRGRATDVYFASGNGGNKLYVVPELRMVVSILSRAYGQARGQRRSEDILKAVLAAVDS